MKTEIKSPQEAAKALKTYKELILAADNLSKQAKDNEKDAAEILAALEAYCKANEITEITRTKNGDYGVYESNADSLIAPKNLTDEQLLAKLKDIGLEAYMKKSESIKTSDIRKLLMLSEPNENADKLREIGFKLEKKKEFKIV
jgi:hypothetical protein